MPLRCLTISGTLLTLVRNLFIRDDVENLPSLMRFIASVTVLKLGRTMTGCFGSLISVYSTSKAMAGPRASASHVLHFLHLSLSLAEWKWTSTRA